MGWDQLETELFQHRFIVSQLVLCHTSPNQRIAFKRDRHFVRVYELAKTAPSTVLNTSHQKGITDVSLTKISEALP